MHLSECGREGAPTPSGLARYPAGAQRRYSPDRGGLEVVEGPEVLLPGYTPHSDSIFKAGPGSSGDEEGGSGHLKSFILKMSSQTVTRTFIKRLLCARLCAKHFSCLLSLTLPR